MAEESKYLSDEIIKRVMANNGWTEEQAAEWFINELIDRIAKVVFNAQNSGKENHDERTNR